MAANRNVSTSRKFTTVFVNYFNFFFRRRFWIQNDMSRKVTKPTLISISRLVTSPLITTSFPGFSPNRPCWKRGSTYHFILSESDRLSPVWFIHKIALSFHIDHNAPCLPQRNLCKVLSSMFLGTTVIPRRNWKQWLYKILGINHRQPKLTLRGKGVK